MLNKVRRILPAILLLAACSSGDGASARPADPPVHGDAGRAVHRTLALAFLPDRRMLVTEKDGTLFLAAADGNSRLAVAGTPKVASEGQGSLMDVKPHPDFAHNHLVYFSYSDRRADGLTAVVLARATLVDGPAPRLDHLETLFHGDPYMQSDAHYSGRIAFAPRRASVLHQRRADEVHARAGPQGDARQGAAAQPGRDARQRGNPLRRRASTRRSGPTATATCWGSPSTPGAICGKSRWGPRWRRDQPDQARAQLWLAQCLERQQLRRQRHP